MLFGVSSKSGSSYGLASGGADASADSREQTFRLVYRDLAPKLHSCALRIVGSHDDAADIVQDAIGESFRSSVASGGLERISAYLFVAVRRRALSFRRRCRVRDRAQFQIAAEQPQSWPSPHDDICRADASRAVRLAVRTLLRPENLLTLVLRYDYGMSYDEAAFVLGVSGAAIKSSVKRSRRLLRPALASKTIHHQDRRAYS